MNDGEGFLSPSAALETALQAPEPQIRQQALAQLGERTPERRFIPVLMALRDQDPDPQIQATAAALLTHWSQPGQHPPHRDPYGQFGL
jgi:HEAT repeat protein